MDKNSITLTESELRNVIKNSVKRALKESTPTPNNDTLDVIDTIRYGRDVNKDWRAYESSDKIDQLHELIIRSIHCLQGLKDYCPSYYYEAIWKHLNQATKICDRIGQKEIMNQGEQPDEYYSQKHLTKNRRRGYGQTERFEGYGY